MNISENVYNLLSLSFLVILGGVILTGILFGLFKIKAPNWVFLSLGILPLVFIFLWTPNNRIISAHGLWHTSIVYQIMNGNIPPGHPYLAGEPLLYPWGTRDTAVNKKLVDDARFDKVFKSDDTGIYKLSD